MQRRRVQWIASILLLFAIGWAVSSFVDGRSSDSVAAPSAQTVEPRAEATRTVPAITPEPTDETAGWEVYWQNPSDTVPTIVHDVCPQSEATQTEYRIEPGQRFLARVSTCRPYKDREVIEVKMLTENGNTVRGYAVRFDSFEPATPE